MSVTPDQEWWSAAELAASGLPDMPGTKRRVNAMADRLGWQSDPSRFRRRTGRGGGREYHWTLLPARTRSALLARAAAPDPAHDPAPVGRTRDEAWAAFEALPEKHRDTARQRLQTIQTVEALELGGLTRDQAIRDTARIEGRSARVVWTWFEQIRGVAADDRLAYLAPRYGSRVAGKRAEIDPIFGNWIKSDYLRLAQPSFRSCYDRAVRRAKAEGVETVTYHTARRWYRREVSTAVETLCRKGIEALKRLYPSQIRDRSNLHALEGVNGDYHKFDVFVRMPTPDGMRVQRPQLVAFQDLFSGKILAWRLSHSANSQTVQLCLGDLIEQWGIPEHVLLDNGREFAAKLITGGTPTRFRFKVREDDVPGLLTTLGCEVHWATPKSGQSKPIERAFRDLCDRVARHPVCDGAYTGNKPEAKPEDYGSRAVDFETFRALVDDEIAEHNARPDRRSEVAFGRSFDDVFAESYAVAPIRKATAEQRRLWLLGAEGVMVNRTDGRITLFGNSYWDAFLHEYLGQKVIARFDDQNLWEGIHVYALAGQYLGHAPCSEKTGFFNAEGAKEIKRRRTAFAAATRDLARRQRDLTAAELSQGIMDNLPPTPPAETGPEASVVRLPEPHPRAPRVAARTPDDEMPRVASVTALPARPEDERDRFARARELEAQRAAGTPLTPDQETWLRSYQTAPEYVAQKELLERLQKTRG